MTMLDTGTYGAKVQSYERVSPRDLLKKVLDEHTTRDEEKILKAFRRELDEQDERDDYLEAIIKYWFANNFRSLVKNIPTFDERKQRRKELHDRTEKTKKAMLGKIHEKAKLIFLEMVLPNGKSLRDCTGAECIRLGPKVGKFLIAIGKTLRPKQIVGEIYTTDGDLQKFWKIK